MKQEELNEIIANHGRWLRNIGGKRADLNKEDLRGANLDRASRGSVT